MRTALVQLGGDLSAPLAQRVEEVAGTVAGLGDADLVVLPELWAQGAWNAREWASSAEPLPGSVVPVLADAARAADAYLHCGSVVERADDGTLYNTAVLLGPDGATLATYRKVHRFGFDSGEAAVLGAGPGPVTAAVAGTVAGLATCYDLRFPELFRALVDLGAELVVMASSWPAARIGHWSTLARARAIEDQVWLVACNQTGTQRGVALGGRSVVVSPWGEVVAEADDTEQVLVADIDLSFVATTRAEFPVLRDRRL
ncbi:putative amidohydrolase [Motilibacter peucedani]|uniref:Putative amidohydrolase n=1 Tax=Motilibacter peucedani TaxID=598650 RepID=A0A420XUR2_9ACTN|nr:nitrilase-related carbon-nitrogen hydrolase [Motilibacter peucedani]RKS80480.1 putative amidohydrolase [Motilibacter peucedani]